FYNEQDDKAVVSYDGAVLLNAAQTKDKAEAQAKTAASKKAKSEQQIIKDCIEKELGDGNETLLSSLGPKLKEDGIIYPTGVGELGKYLKEKFDKYPKLFNVYELILGDKRDRVVRKTK
ncbi:MAG: hypothetical protein K2N14_03505, partial [Clostridia bacterium]|nr:hypothetical protein [Clostridia bacterium]